MNFYFSKIEKQFNIFITRNWKMSGNDVVYRVVSFI